MYIYCRPEYCFFSSFSFDDASLFDDDYGQPPFFHHIPFPPFDKEDKNYSTSNFNNSFSLIRSTSNQFVRNKIKEKVTE